MESTVTIPALQQMKRDGKKIAGVVAWDYQIARIADRAGVDIVAFGRAARPPQSVPVGIEFDRGSELHF